MNQLASVNMCSRDLTLSLSCCTRVPTAGRIGFEISNSSQVMSEAEAD